MSKFYDEISKNASLSTTATNIDYTMVDILLLLSTRKCTFNTWINKCSMARLSIPRLSIFAMIYNYMYSLPINIY